MSTSFVFIFHAISGVFWLLDIRRILGQIPKDYKMRGSTLKLCSFNSLFWRKLNESKEQNLRTC